MIKQRKFNEIILSNLISDNSANWIFSILFEDDEDPHVLRVHLHGHASFRLWYVVLNNVTIIMSHFEQ